MNGIEYTNKKASLWEASDIEQLVGIEEGTYLEFKKPSEFFENKQYSREKFVTELTETVSAFLNSDGGVILIGVQTDRDTKVKRREILKSFTSWSADQTFGHLDIYLTEYQVRDIINSNIMPKPIGVEAKAIDIALGDNTATVFIVTVPWSPIGAHQATRQKIYYRRTADGDEPMLDYEIRNVNNRRAGPLLRLACAVRNVYGEIYEENWMTSQTQTNQIKSQDTLFSRVNVVFSTTNLGRGTASIAKFDIGIASPWEVHKYSPKGINIGAHWEPNNELEILVGKSVTVFWIPEIINDSFLRNKGRIYEQKIKWQAVTYNGNQPPAYPIWPTTGRRMVGELELRIQDNQGVHAGFWLPWRILSEGMPEMRGAVYLSYVSGHVRVTNYEIDEVSWWGDSENDQTFKELKQRYRID